MLKIDDSYNLMITKLYHSSRNTCLIDQEFLSEVSMTSDDLDDFLSTPSKNKGLVIGKHLTNGGYLQANLTDKGIAYFDNGFSLDRNNQQPIIVKQTIHGGNGNFSALNQGSQKSSINNNPTIDDIIKLLKKSDNPNKDEIIRIAEEYKLSPSMELFGKFVGMCGNTGTVGQVLAILIQSLR